MADLSPIVAILLPIERRPGILGPAAEARLSTVARVISAPGPGLRPDELPDLLEGAVACLTGWGTPPLDAEVLASCPSLRLVAHTAGSIHRLVPPSAMAGGLRVSHAAAVIADAVAEQVLLAALLWARPLHKIDQMMRSGGHWNDVRERFPGRQLGSMTVGIVGTGRVGRAVIRAFRGLGCTVLASDPYLTDADAASLRVERVELDTLFRRSDVASLHAPVLSETRGMIDGRRLGLLRDGALFIQAARPALVDEAALWAELTSGRIDAALDVFDEEPLPLDSPYRRLPNAIISPHTAGHTLDTHLRQGQAMVEEVERLLRGEPLQYEITPEMLPILA